MAINLSPSAPDGLASRRTLVPVALLVLAALVAYANSFSVPLLFDDWVTITQNPKLRTVWPIWPALSPPEQTGVGGRPVANLSLVLNYAISGESVVGFHAGNLLIHLAAALALFGLVRRTLLLPRWQGRFRPAAPWVALVAAGWWLLHPLQTQSVTYISQRTESLLGLFYLLTLYGFLRAVSASRPGPWGGVTIAACFAGMGSKEGMVTAPVMVFVFDYVFVTGSVGEIWRRRWRLYIGMACSWLLLLALMGGLGGRGVGFGHGMGPGTYLLIEGRAIFHYLGLALWPHPLVFDYGVDLPPAGWRDAIAVGALAGIGGLAVRGIRRRSVAAFLAAWFLVTLAPTSSFVPIPLQPISENRVYVPLAAVVTGLALVVHRYSGRRGLAAGAVVAAALGAATLDRNRDYHSEITLWADTVAKVPASSRAYSNLGYAFQQTGRLAEARKYHEMALRLKPDHGEAHVNLAAVLGQLGEVDGALAHARRAVELNPQDGAAVYNLGVAYRQSGDVPAAIAAFEAAVTLRPTPEAHHNLALLFLRAGRTTESIAQAEAALRLNPGFIDARYVLACSLLVGGRAAEALPQFEQVLKVRPADAEVLQNYALALRQLGRGDEAMARGASAPGQR